MMMTDMMRLSPIGGSSSENLGKRVMCAKPNWQLELARFVSSICMEEGKEAGNGTGTTSIPENYVMRQKYLGSYKFCRGYGETDKTALRRTKMWIKDVKKNVKKLKGRANSLQKVAQVTRCFCRALVAKSGAQVPMHQVPVFYVGHYP